MGKSDKAKPTGWHTIQTSLVRKHLASDDHWAGFTQRASFDVPAAPFGNPRRVRVDMTWYKPGDPSHAQGHSTHEVDVYLTMGFPESPFNQFEACVFSAG